MSLAPESIFLVIGTQLINRVRTHDFGFNWVGLQKFNRAWIANQYSCWI